MGGVPWKAGEGSWGRALRARIVDSAGGDGGSLEEKGMMGTMVEDRWSCGGGGLDADGGGCDGVDLDGGEEDGGDGGSGVEVAREWGGLREKEMIWSTYDGGFKSPETKEGVGRGNCETFGWGGGVGFEGDGGRPSGGSHLGDQQWASGGEIGGRNGRIGGGDREAGQDHGRRSERVRRRRWSWGDRLGRPAEEMGAGWGFRWRGRGGGMVEGFVEWNSQVIL